MPRVNLYSFHPNHKRGEPTQTKGAFTSNMHVFWQKLLRRPLLEGKGCPYHLDFVTIWCIQGDLCECLTGSGFEEDEVGEMPHFFILALNFSFHFRIWFAWIWGILGISIGFTCSPTFCKDRHPQVLKGNWAKHCLDNSTLHAPCFRLISTFLDLVFGFVPYSRARYSLV